MEGLGSTTIFAPTGQKCSHAKRIPVVSSLVSISNSREGVRMPSLSRVSTAVQFTNFSWSQLYDLNTITRDNEKGQKRRKNHCELSRPPKR